MRDFEEALTVIILGIILYGIAGAVLCGILSTFEPLWTYFGSSAFARAFRGTEIATWTEAFGVLIGAHLAFLPLQVPQAVLGVLVGTGARNVKETLWPNQEA